MNFQQLRIIRKTVRPNFNLTEVRNALAKGRAAYNAKNNSNLKAPAPNPKTKADEGRKKSFCARMSGMPGPMKDEKGRPTRKAASLKNWNC